VEPPQEGGRSVKQDIQEIKRRAGMSPVERRTGKPLRYGELMKCPFHEDSTPSFGPYEKDGLPRWKCFGCQWEGDVLDFVAKRDSISTGAAIELLANAPPAQELVSAGAEITTPAEERSFKYSVAQLEKAETQIEKAAGFLMSRGIKLETARALRFGYENGYVVMPYFVEGELVAVKLRATNPKSKADKWQKHVRDKGVYHLFNRDSAATIPPDDLYVVEAELDAAMLVGLGFDAVSVDSSGHKLTASDAALLKQANRVILALDSDTAGQECAKRIEAAIPAEKRLRIVPHTKDLGDLHADAPHKFAGRLAKLVRFAEVTRPDFTWNDLLTESEIVEQQGLEIKYAVDKLIPAQRITMLFGREKSGKSLLALYMAKCVCNGRKVFDNYNVENMPALYLDAEAGVLGAYIGWMRPNGPTEIRYRTLGTGIPALDSPALLKICHEHHPLLIVDSLHKFFGQDSKVNPWQSADMEQVLEKLRGLAVAGATVILIHHATKADPEQYRDSSAIGAGVDFLFAVVGAAPENGVTRVRLIGQPSRGAQPPSLNLITFPHLIDIGKITLEECPPKTDVERIVEFVAGAGKATKRQIREDMKGIGSRKKDAALETAIEKRILELDSEGFFTVPGGRARTGQFSGVPQAGHTAGTVSEEMEF
jgi:hypothetical protein